MKTGDLKCVLHFLKFMSFNYRQAINLMKVFAIFKICTTAQKTRWREMLAG